jgi:hypothetical protein
MAGADRLQAIRKGAKRDEVIDAGKDSRYHLKRLGKSFEK